ncbi:MULTISPECIES: hypothetical protein [Agrobacterium]|uniref:Uncharacterized protein n=1 Tax=Agrobacterium tumefaciens TaxID=358 RepID=A0AAE6BAP0_AGRTU|nr:MULTISPECIES: hypothetical protein [Agrobacterium]QCL73395.1 hypothetical protein CFBP5499_08185 [Agrobacterium tumefaciens]QCL78967.1 hypothetical protein CFBP5877_07715 [Agrobacterium tumefaciens]CUX42448.1 conserved hypothetical protein [Agrobacterium sp. NCPPB 925]
MATAAIRLPEERAEQARQLAAHKGVNLADLVGGLIVDEIKRLGLGQQIGLGNIDIATLEDGKIHFDFGAGVHIWSREQALDIAKAIENALARKGGKLDVDAEIEVARVGVSVRLKNIGTGHERTFAPSIGRELVALLRRHGQN